MNKSLEIHIKHFNANCKNKKPFFSVICQPEVVIYEMTFSPAPKHAYREPPAFSGRPGLTATTVPHDAHLGP
jgi:hypothetical protein